MKKFLISILILVTISAMAAEPMPDWIRAEGIRAGFVTSTAGDLTRIPRYVETAKDLGLNSLIVYGCSFAETPNHLRYYREWFRQCKSAGLHVFAFYPWQPPVGNTCRPCVFADGKEGLFPCPLDDQLWDKYLASDIADKLARESIDGLFLDMEMYRTEKEPELRRRYTYDACFCDSCFRLFLRSQGMAVSKQVARDRRKQWLEGRGLLEKFYFGQIARVETRAERLKAEVRAVNPNLIFGVYPALSDADWVQAAVMRALGRDSIPVISFSTDTYGYALKPWGADRIPASLTAYFDGFDINGIYASGFLLRRYPASEIGSQISRSCDRGQGYWLFKLSQLVEDVIPDSDRPAGGTRSDYLRAIRAANAALPAR